MEQVLYPLPEGWEWKKLAELAKTTSGGTPSRSNKDYWGGSIPWVKSGELGDGRVENNEEFITELGLKNSSAKLFSKESLLLALYGATAGKLGILTYDAATNQAVCCITQNNKLLERDFLRYYLLSQRKKIIEDSFGGAQPNISQAYVRNIDIPAPPLSEQKRIVEKLNALLTRIDTAIEHLQESIKLADALFKSTLSSLVCNESTEHEKLSLEELGSFSGGGTPSKSKSEFWNGDILWVTPKDMKSPVITNSELKITQEGVNGSSAKFVPPRSVLIVARSGILRHTLPVCINESECTVNQDIKVFIPGKKVSAEYIQYMLKGYERFILSELVKGGVTVESLKYKEFQSFKFPIPSTEEQQKIVQKLSLVRQFIDPLKTELTHKINHLQKLNRSILDFAFKGEL